jgi:hypothetical protein
MKYRLIKKYPCLPNDWYVGLVVTKKYNTIYSPDIAEGFCVNLCVDQVENNPEFWEKVEKKDYEVLTIMSNFKYIFYKNENNLYLPKVGSYSPGLKGFPLEDVNIPANGLYIHSVKRLSDGEIFTVGDKIDCKGWFGNIIKFEIINNELQIFQQQHIGSSKYKPFLIQDLIKSKQPLFKTEDGVDIYEGNKSYGIHSETFEDLFHNNTPWYKGSKPCEYHLHFLTKEAAEEYILMNKPCLSIKEIAPIFGMYHLDNSKTSLDRLSNKLKQLVKNKL